MNELIIITKTHTTYTNKPFNKKKKGFKRYIYKMIINSYKNKRKK